MVRQHSRLPGNDTSHAKEFLCHKNVRYEDCVRISHSLMYINMIFYMVILTAVEGNTYHYSPVSRAPTHRILRSTPSIVPCSCINLAPQERLDLLPPHNFSLVYPVPRHAPPTQPFNRLRKFFSTAFVSQLLDRVLVRLLCRPC
jgi:hypothetical protein